MLVKRITQAKLKMRGYSRNLCLSEVAEFAECVLEAFISCRPGQIPDEATVLVNISHH